MSDRVSRPWQKNGTALKARLAIAVLFVGSLSVLAISPASAAGIAVGTCELDALLPPHDCLFLTGVGAWADGAGAGGSVYYDCLSGCRKIEVYIETELLDPYLDGPESELAPMLSSGDSLRGCVLPGGGGGGWRLYWCCYGLLVNTPIADVTAGKCYLVAWQ